MISKSEEKYLSERLVKYGFIKSKNWSLYKNDKKGLYALETGEVDTDHADEEWAEEANIQGVIPGTKQYFKTGFPKPYKRFRLIIEQPNQSIEQYYFWILGHLRQDQSFPYFVKLTDIFSASEQSAFFGQASQKLGIQQDRAQQYLATIGKLTRDFFPMIRELRIMDERLELYKQWGKSKSADVTLKGIFTDFSEGGTKNPQSVYGLAQTVGFTIIPDLFFTTQIYDEKDIDEIVDGLAYNAQVLNVLKRKLHQYILWKKKTEEELVNRRRFTLKYLRQHWNIVRLYIAWVKPYLKNIKRMHMNQKMMDSIDLISAFEGSMTEIEFLAYRPTKNNHFSCVLASFEYRTRPQMQYRQEYQQGPIHSGRMVVDLRAYGWQEKQIGAFQQMRNDEDMDLIGIIQDDLKQAMDAYGEEMIKYLRESGEDIDEKEKDVSQSNIIKPRGPGAAEPFLAVFKGLGELATALVPIQTGSKKPKGSSIFKPNPDMMFNAAKEAEGGMYQVYKNFKKAHGMLSW